MADINEAVRAWAKGMYATEAAVELLIRSGRVIYEKAPWISESTVRSDGRPCMASIDHEVLLDESGPWSGGEQRIVRVAVSLLGGPPVDLSEVIPSLDRHNAELVLAAIAHANGSHEHGDVDFGENGKLRRLQKLDSLYPWPEPA